MVEYKKENITRYDSWRIVELEELITSISNGATYDPESSAGFPITRIETIAEGTINPEKVGLTPYMPSLEKFKLKKGEILYSHINSVAHIGKTAYCEYDYEILHGMNLLKIKPKDSIDGKFLYYILNSKFGSRQAYSAAKRAVNQASLSTTEIKKFKFPIPPLIEQKAIAKILSTWDEAITKFRAYITQLQQRNKWLMHVLLTGQKRFSKYVISNEKIKTKVGDLPMDWNLICVSNIVKRIRKSITPELTGLYREIGIRSHAKGIFYKEPITGKSLGDKSVFLIQPGCFIVNIVFAWEHAISKTTEYEIGMIASHRFPMYKPKKEILDLDYLLYFFKTERGKHLLGLASPGGAGRNKTLGQEEFMKLQIPVPSIEEQKRIASVILRADEELKTLEVKLEKLKEQKRGLMQQLLTGKIRIKSN